MAKLVGRVRAVGNAHHVGDGVVPAPEVPEGWVVEPEQRYGAEVTVIFESGEVFTIDASDQRSAAIVDLLRQLSHAQVPVYVESNTYTNAISRVLLPAPFTVVTIADEPTDNQLVVEFLESHQQHFVSMTNPDSPEIVEQLRQAQRESRHVLVTEESDRPEIIDVRPANGPPTAAGLAPPKAAVHEARPTLLAASEVPYIIVDQMFTMLKSADCWSASAPPTCIPYSYPDDGCAPRAHEGARLMIEKGVTPFKIWSYGVRTCRTANSPMCKVTWRYHTALYVWARLSTGTSVPMVIDPSVVHAPATIAQWLAVQSAPATATVEYTDPAVYLPNTLTGTGPLYDPNYAVTYSQLNHWRSKFIIRCTIENPPGPAYLCP